MNQFTAQVCIVETPVVKIVIFAVKILRQTLWDENFIWLTSRLTIPIALSAFFIRIGNLFNSEIVGHETSIPWGMTFLRRTDLDLVPRHPTQVYEALAYLIVFVILLVIYRSVKAKRADFLILGCFNHK